MCSEDELRVRGGVGNWSGRRGRKWDGNGKGTRKRMDRCWDADTRSVSAGGDRGRLQEND